VKYVGEVADVLCKQAHAAIREAPIAEKKERKAPGESRSWKPKKLTYEERKASLKVPPSPLLQ